MKDLVRIYEFCEFLSKENVAALENPHNLAVPMDNHTLACNPRQNQQNCIPIDLTECGRSDGMGVLVCAFRA
jgi:hypothetical protein